MANNQITPFQLTDQFTMDNFNQRINETNIALQNKADLGEDGKVPAEQVDAYSQSDSISAETRTALSLPETATPDAALAEIARQLSESGGVTMTMLWENASPSSVFAAQSINVNNAENYDHFLIDTKDWVSEEFRNYYMVPKNKPSRIGYTGAENSSAMYYSRELSINNNIFTFGEGKINGAVSYPEKRVIPIVIYGMKLST